MASINPSDSAVFGARTRAYRLVWCPALIPGEHNMTEMVAALSPIGGNASLIKGGIGEEDVFHPMDEDRSVCMWR